MTRRGRRNRAGGRVHCFSTGRSKALCEFECDLSKTQRRKGDKNFFGRGNIWLVPCAERSEVCWYRNLKVTELDAYCLNVERRSRGECRRRYFVNAGKGGQY